MTKENTCCFTGHRELYASKESLTALVYHHVCVLYDRGIRNYCCGGALGFDTLAAQVVLEFRKDHPDARLVLILPCPEQAKFWNPEDVKVYEEIKSLADDVIYTHNRFTRFCMHLRNRRLVDESSVCISHLVKSTGGTAYTVKYAKQQGIEIIDLT